MLPLGDPVGTGLVPSLANHSTNLTGTTNLAPQMMVKGLELLKETLPRLSRVLVLTYPRDPISRGQITALQGAARSLGVELLVSDIDRAEDLAPAFAAGRKNAVEGVLVTVESIFQVNRDLIVELARANALPGVFSEVTFVRAGGLLSYDSDRQLLMTRSADFVDKVLKGVLPRDLPIEQPTVFTIAINKGTARALGITIPQSILARADEVVE